jgi:hypothetical protein
VKDQYIVDDFGHTLAHVVEEAGELLAALGKTLRWGWASHNPELPIEQQESNIVWVRRELDDLKGAIARFEKVLNEDRLP